MQLIKKRRVHRLVVVEGEVCFIIPAIFALCSLMHRQEEEKKGGKKGRLAGIITLSDVLRHVIGEVGIGEVAEPPPSTSTSTQVPTPAAELTPVPMTPAVPKGDEQPAPEIRNDGEAISPPVTAEPSA